MNAKAHYYNLDVPLKFLRFYKVLFVISLSISIFDCSFIHLCCKASEALIRLPGLYCNNPWIKSIASLLIVCHSSSSVLYLPSLTFFIIYSSFDPLKGGYPQRRIYNITPMLQRSHFSS